MGGATAMLMFACATFLLTAPPPYLSPPIKVLARLRLASVLLLAAGLIAGLPYFWLRAARAREGLESEARQTLSVAGEAVLANVAHADVLARLLSTQSAVSPFLAAPGPATRGPAEEAIDRHASAYVAAVAYLMDREGVVVAASNRVLPGNAIGRSAAAEPLFADAANGYQGRQFVATVSPPGRSYHSSASVGAGGRFVGVAAIEADVERWNLFHEGPVAGMLVHADGTVFLSSRTEWRLRRLWPADPNLTGGVESSRGTAAEPPLLSREPGDGEITTLGQRRVLVLRGPTPLPGWSVVVLSPAQEMNTAILLSFATLLAGFVGWLSLIAMQHVWIVSSSRIALAESRYRAIFDSAPAWISVVDPDGLIVMANPAGERAWHDGSASPVGRRFLELWPADVRPRIEDAVARADAGEKVMVELRTARPGGEVVDWSLSVMPVAATGAGRRQLLIVGEDITARRLAERTTLVTERMAAVGTLAAGIAHQFNNINMGLLSGLAALEHLPQGSARRAPLAAEVRSLVGRAVDISNRLLGFSSPGAEGRARIHLGAIAKEAAALVEESLRGQGIDFQLRLDDTSPVVANIDSIKFVVVSLVTNARDAVAGRAVRRITVRTGARDDGVILSVADSGPGLSPEALSQVFNPFYTRKGEWAVPGSASSGARGLGLSLSVCQSIVRDHGGRIQAANGPDGGALFTVLLPAAPESGAPPV